LAYCAGIAAVDRLVEPVFFGRFIDVKKQTTLEEYDLSENLIHLILISSRNEDQGASQLRRFA
jgi:hypothetical protein